MKRKIVIISGPTACGKTDLSLQLAKLLKEHLKIDSGIVNFDSLLFYKELNIGTAKPEKSILSSFEHHLINICSARDFFSSADFVPLAKDAIKHIHAKQQVAILVGGSGFYLRALMKGMYVSKKSSSQTKKKLAEQYSSDGITPFVSFLEKHDRESLRDIHPNDHYRISRAVEHFQSTGTKLSDEKRRMDNINPYNFKEHIFRGCDLMHVYLDIPKNKHLEIIENRTSKMLKSGWIEEVQDLFKNGFTGEEKPLRSIGYNEIISYLNNQLPDFESLQKRIVISTRQLAKSQRTFFNKIIPKFSYDPLMDEKVIHKDVLAFIDKQE